MTAKKIKKYPQSTKDLIRHKALDQGKERFEIVIESVSAAMLKIETEIKDNDGVYPANGGSLTLSELLRRSNVGSKTLFGSKYKDGFKREVVDSWLEKIKTLATTSRKEVQKSALERVSEWRNLYEDLLRSHRKSELDLQEALRKLAEAEKQIVEYASESKRVKERPSKAAGGKVVPINQSVG